MTGAQFTAQQSVDLLRTQTKAGDWADRMAAAALTKLLTAYGDRPVASCVPR